MHMINSCYVERRIKHILLITKLFNESNQFLNSMFFVCFWKSLKVTITGFKLNHDMHPKTIIQIQSLTL